MAISPTIDAPVGASVDLTTGKSLDINATLSATVTYTLIVVRVPTMGYLYQPTDVDGEVVPVQGQLANFYRLLTEDDPPQLYWGTQYWSADYSNDQYDPWRLQ